LTVLWKFPPRSLRRSAIIHSLCIFLYSRACEMVIAGKKLGAVEV
jgi:hypothetical protein